MKKSITIIATTLAFALAAGVPAAPRGVTLHFMVEDALLRSVPLRQWNAELSRLTLKAGLLLCTEMKRAEKASACDVSFRGAISVTAFDRALENGLHRAEWVGTPPDAVDENGLNFLFDQATPSERRIYVVGRLLSCGRGKGVTVGCTRVSGPVTVMAVRW